MLQNAPSSSTDIEVPYLKAQHVQWDGVGLSDLPNMWASPYEVESLHVTTGDLLVCEGGEVGRASIVAGNPPEETIIQNALHLVRGRDTGEPRFLAYLLRHAATQDWFEVLCNRSTIAHFTVEKFREMWASLPGAPLQRAIADYLDRETARLDAMVAAKQQVLGLLAEKRRALITRAVTRGLDPRASLRDSGIPWLGKIPAYWSLCHLKRVLSSLDYGISESVDVTGCIAVLRMGDIRDGELDYSNIGFVDSVEESLLLRPGDLLFNRTNSLDQIGKVALFRGRSDYPVSFASYLVRLRCKPSASPDFLNWLLNSAFPLAWGRSEALPAIGQANLNPNRYAYLPIALPPLPEQYAIVAHIAAETAKVDGMRCATERTIALLKERRAALIAAAITGQIDIPEATA